MCDGEAMTNNDVKRFVLSSGFPREHADGKYVLATDYDSLLSRVARLEEENARLRTELHVVAEAIWQNVNATEMRHWAQGIKVNIAGDLPKFTVEF